MGIGSKIRYFRTKNNLTQKELAVGVCATSYLSKIENEIVEPSDEMLDIFSSKLGLETTDLKLEVDLLHQLQLKALELHRAIRNGCNESAIVLYNDFIAKYRMSIDPLMQVFKVLFGLRIALMKKEREEARIYTRHGNDVTSRYIDLQGINIPVKNCILDGEMVCFEKVDDIPKTIV